MTFTPTGKQPEILEAEDDLLVIGGAGSGKTTVALEKARRFVRDSELAADQQVLFLSFSNTAVHRIQEASRLAFTAKERSRIAVTTFHSFCHEVLGAHWRLVGLGAPFQLLSPGEVTVLRTRHADDEEAEAAILALETKGRVCFDRYAPLVIAFLDRVEVLRAAYATAYPLVIVDEYQDTADPEHELVRRLAKPGQLICCGDPKQRIYEFRSGTRDDRLDQAEGDFWLRRITLTRNHRSTEADIEEVAAAILRGDSRIPKPGSVRVDGYRTHAQLATKLKLWIIELERVIRRLTGQPSREVSIAIMCFPNRFVGKVSSLLTEPSGTFKRPFRHRVLLPQESLAFAWQAVSNVLVPGTSVTAKMSSVLRTAALLHRVEAGDATTRIAAAERLERWAAELEDGTLTRRAAGVYELLDRIGGLVGTWTGNPMRDATRITDAFRGLPGNHLGHVVRVLDLRPFGANALGVMGELEEAHRLTDEYVGVERLVEQSLLEERLQGDLDAGTRRVLMTMHKCKGREFDAAIIVDGRGGNSIVLRRERGAPEQPESRRLLATSIQRARFAAIVMTDGAEPCPLIPTFEETGP